MHAISQCMITVVPHRPPHTIVTGPELHNCITLYATDLFACPQQATCNSECVRTANLAVPARDGPLPSTRHDTAAWHHIHNCEPPGARARPSCNHTFWRIGLVTHWPAPTTYCAGYARPCSQLAVLVLRGEYNRVRQPTEVKPVQTSENGGHNSKNGHEVANTTHPCPAHTPGTAKHCTALTCSASACACPSGHRSP